MSISSSQLLVIEIATCDIAEVRIDEVKNHRCLFSRKSFAQDEVIVSFNAKAVYTSPNYLTIQLGEHEHIELLPEYLECTNHSCDPNCFFETTGRQLVAIRNIRPGEELTFFYPSTEWEMDRTFQCTCGSDQCLGVISGARYLSSEQRRKYKFTDFITQKIGELSI